MPLIGWLAKQLPSWHTPYSGPDHGLNAVTFPKLRNVCASILFGNLSLLVPYLWFFQRHLNASYRLARQATAQLAHPLFWP